MQLTDAYIDT